MTPLFNVLVQQLKTTATNISETWLDFNDATYFSVIATFVKTHMVPYLMTGDPKKLYEECGSYQIANSPRNMPTFVFTALANMFVDGVGKQYFGTRHGIKKFAISAVMNRKTKRIAPVIYPFEKGRPLPDQYNGFRHNSLFGLYGFPYPTYLRKGRSHATSMELYYTQLFMAVVLLTVFDPDCAELKGLKLALDLFDSKGGFIQTPSIKKMIWNTRVCCNPVFRPIVAEVVYNEPNVKRIRYIDIHHDSLITMREEGILICTETNKGKYCVSYTPVNVNQ